MALASRTEAPELARELISLLEIDHLFPHQQIYPSSKLRHFTKLREDTNIAFEEILFFDDEMRNIREVGGLGVTAVFVSEGLTQTVFENGLETWRTRNLG